jgi:hybrid polyketide synthase/nonribosomal peptide synthetase ACE1
MGSQLIQESKLASDTVDQLQASLDSLPSEYRPTWSLRAELLKPKESSRVTQAEISQPLCAAVQIILVNLLRTANVRFKAVVGHSSGEIVAAYAAGFLSSSDAIRIAYLRGFSLSLAKGGAPASVTGAMLAAGTSFEDAAGLVELESLHGRIVVAASNSPESVTLSGDSDAIEEAKQILDDEGKFARLLKVDKAYHSHHMIPSSQPYIDTMKKVRVHVQQPPTTGEYPIWVSSVLGDAIEGVTASELSAEYWSRNMVSPVLFSQAVEYALGAHGPFDLVVEVGPHPALKSPTLNTITAATGQSIPYTGILRRGAHDLEAFGEGLGYIWQNFGRGIVNFTSLELNGHGSGVQIPKLAVLKGLPGYAWEHDREYWHESRYSKALRNNNQPPHPLLGSRVPDGTQNESRWRNYLNVREVPWLVHHQIQRQIIFPAAGYLVAVVEALVQLYGQESVQLIDFSGITIGQALVLEEDASSVEILVSFREISRDAKEAEGVFAFYSEPPSSKGTGQLAMNASGQVAVSLGIPSEHALPEPYQPKGQFLSIEPERFYKETDELGFGYSGSFRKLVHTSRRMDEAIGEIRLPDSEDEGDVPIIIHPGTLDSAIQSTMLAFSYPGDGRLRSIYLPTGIDRLRINPWAYAKHKGAPGSRLAFYSAVEPDRATDLNGGFEVSTLDRRVTLIQLQGLRTTPLTPSSVDNDRNLFTETTWAPEYPSGNGPLVGTDAEDGALALDMERVAYYYMREVDGVVAPADRHTLEKHHQAFYRYFDHNLTWVAEGKHPFLKESINDSSLDILNIFDK